MNNLESTLENGWPALLVMLAAILILAFLRLVVPYLIARRQRKHPIHTVASGTSRPEDGS